VGEDAQMSQINESETTFLLKLLYCILFHSFIREIYLALLQGYYSEALRSVLAGESVDLPPKRIAITWHPRSSITSVG